MAAEFENVDPVHGFREPPPDPDLDAVDPIGAGSHRTPSTISFADELDEMANEPRLVIRGVSEDGETFEAPISHEQLARARQLRDQLDD
jgi:hypothetical protein